jgi:hypothetical protein
LFTCWCDKRYLKEAVDPTVGHGSHDRVSKGTGRTRYNVTSEAVNICCQSTKLDLAFWQRL